MNLQNLHWSLAVTDRSEAYGDSHITIPPEALEAGKDSAFAWLRSYMEDDVRVREMTDDELTELVSAACIAMLKNWPRVVECYLAETESYSLALPLTQENER